MYGHFENSRTLAYSDIQTRNPNPLNQSSVSNTTVKHYENVKEFNHNLEIDGEDYMPYVIITVLCFALLLITGLGIALYFWFCKNYSFRGFKQTIISEDFANMPVSEKQETIKNTLATNPKYDKFTDQKFNQVKIDKDRKDASQVIANLQMLLIKIYL